MPHSILNYATYHKDMGNTTGLPSATEVPIYMLTAPIRTLIYKNNPTLEFTDIVRILPSPSNYYMFICICQSDDTWDRIDIDNTYNELKN